MGPIETELRRQRPIRGTVRVAYTPALSFTSLGVTFEAAAQLGLTSAEDYARHLPDVLSEAIEAAEALGL